jgi:hypothetical protein
MQTQPRSKLTAHRRQRIILWALTMLHWFAKTLLDYRIVTKRHLAQRGDYSLHWLTRLVTNIALHRARDFLGRVPNIKHHRRHGRDLRRRHIRRSLIGARVRHALKHKDIATHIARLIEALRNIDHTARQLAKRYRRLRRLWSIKPPIAPCAARYGALAPSPASCDSS